MIATPLPARRFLLAALLPTLALATSLTPLRAASMDVARQLNDAFAEVAERGSASVVVIRVAHRPDALHGTAEDSPFFEFLPKEFKKQFQDELKAETASA